MKLRSIHALFLFAICAFSVTAQTPAKRPMTFEDMMQMRRLGETEVSPDGKWLVYSVTDVDLAKNTRPAKLWIQPIAPDPNFPEPRILGGTQPGDSGPRFSHDGKQILFLSSRSGSQQIWILGFDTASGTTRNPYDANPLDGPFQLTHNSIEPDNALGRPTARRSSSPPPSIPTARHSPNRMPQKAPKRINATRTGIKLKPPRR